MIGKILADRWGWTEKLGGTQTVKIATKVEKSEVRQLKKDIKDCNTTAQVDVVIKQHGLSDIKGLPEHIKELYENGKIKDLKTSDVNKFVLNQRYNDIANQAHGFLGVKKAIKEYNEGIKNGTLNATKFTETISQSNTSLGKYLTGLDGATAGMGKYALSLTTAAVKTFALKTVTMALNMATSFLVSHLVSAAISGIISLYSQFHQTMDDLHDSLEESVNKFDESANEAKELES